MLDHLGKEFREYLKKWVSKRSAASLLIEAPWNRRSFAALGTTIFERDGP